jgi:hypothetical protein
VTVAPDLIEPVVGFRKWRLEGGQLRSPYVAITWREREAHAACHRTSLTGLMFGQSWLEEAHESPHPDCKCGIYAYHEPNARPPMSYLRSVWGIVTLWGRIEVHREGMRAQHARVEALGYPRDWGPLRRPPLESIAAELGVELVEHARLKAAASMYGYPIPQSLLPEPFLTELEALRAVLAPGRPWLSE